jgi:fimbrial chaperone protein
MSSTNIRARKTMGMNVAGIVIAFLLGSAAHAQALSVLPVNIFLQPGERATTMTVTNHGAADTSIQIRGYAWNQKGDEDPLTATDNVIVSPPIATIAAGASQVVRIVLRKSPTGQESTYRILIDQIPPPSEPGVVHVVLRLSIPIFAEPDTRAAPHLLFNVEHDANGKIYLVGINDGQRHDAIHEIALWMGDGTNLKTSASASPYILAGATRRWTIVADGPTPVTNKSLRMTARSDTGTIERQVIVNEVP